MAIFSSLRGSVNKVTDLFSRRGFSVGAGRWMSGGHGDDHGHHRLMAITPSRFQWKKTKDLFHFYAMIGLIPIGLLIFYANVYIGPAKLAPIPEDYVPKHWEYYSHPITRWLARYIYPSRQQEYEKYLHQLYEEDEKMKIRALQDRVLRLMEQRKDYQAFYYLPVDGKYYRIVRQQSEELADQAGFLPPLQEGPAR